MSARSAYDRKTVLYVIMLCALLLASSIRIVSSALMRDGNGLSEIRSHKDPGAVALFGFGMALVAPGSLILYAMAVLGFAQFKSREVRKRIERTTVPTSALDLQGMLNTIATQAGVRGVEPIVIDSSLPNAFVLRQGRKHLVALTIPLLEILDRDELESVLAHEISHIKNKDGRVRIFGLIISSKYFYLPFIHVLVKAILRRREYLADETGATLTGTPLPLISALLKVNGYMTSFSGSMDLYSAFAAFSFVSPSSGALRKLLSSNPTIEDRIRNLMKLLS